MTDLEYTLITDSLKHYKTIIKNGFILGYGLLVANAVLYILTASDIFDHHWSRWILFISLFISTSITSMVLSTGMDMEIDNVNKHSTKEMRQLALDTIYKKRYCIFNDVLIYLNCVVGVGVLLNYARYYAKWWTWVIFGFLMLLYTALVFMSYLYSSSVSDSAKKVQRDINSLISKVGEF